MAPGTGDRGFPRKARLKRQRLIRPLFAAGRPDVGQVRAGPLMIRYRVAPLSEVGVEVPLQVGFAVGRHVGDQPARNRIKRLMREAFRQARPELESTLSGRSSVLTMMILYRGRSGGASSAVFRALPEALRMVGATLDEPTESDT